MKNSPAQGQERGIALVIAMLVLLVMSMVALVLMSSVVLNRTLTGNDQMMRKALNVAEAGIGEAEARIKNQETGMVPTNPNLVCQVFNTVPGSVPALGTDSLGLATGQNVGSYLNYTTAGRGPDVLTINYKKNPAGTAVMRYDATHTPNVNDVTGLPIYVITATGTVGTTRRTVVSEVIQRPYNVNAKAAFAVKWPIQFINGNAVVCGYDHRGDTPYDDGKNGRLSGPGGPFDCSDNENNIQNLPGAWSEGTIPVGGTANTSGTPNISENQTGFYTGPWDMLGLSQSEFWGWIGPGRTSLPNYTGIYYIDNDNIPQNYSASFALHNIDGEGMLYVDGNLTLNAGFHWKGLIYVEGDLTVNGQAWILGAVVVHGVASVKANGGTTILYSSEAVSQNLTKYGGQFVTLSWREK